MKPRTASLIQVNSAVFLWGVTLMFPKIIDMPPEGMVFYRAIISAIALAIFVKATGGKLGVKRLKDYWVMGALGLIMCVHWVTLFHALQMTDVAVAIIALNTYPALTAIAEPIAHGKWPKRMDVVLAAVVLGGVLIMLPEINFDNNATIAVTLAVISGILFASRNIVIRKYAKGYGGSTLMFYQTLITSLCLVWFIPTTAETYTPRAIGLLLALGVVFTALPQSLYAHGLGHLSAKTVGILSLMQVLYGAFWGYMFFSERIDLRTMIGGAIILGCIILETLRNAGPKQPVPDPVPEM